jgi:HEAT repeat protein
LDVNEFAMPPKRGTVKERIKKFHSQCTATSPEAVQDAVRQALNDRHCLLVKQAAELCEERLLYPLEGELLTAYRRFLKKPLKNDPHCTAKGAIARALVALDSQETDFFIAGLGYQQQEPVWGGTEDTAVDVRVSCAMGLANTSYPRALIALVPLLYDKYAQVRQGAVRAIAYTQPMAAEAVLRAKALAGDLVPDVTAEALSALLRVAPEESREFVTGFLVEKRDSLLREAVALTLGESKLDEALEILRVCWEKEPLKGEQENILLYGAIIHRSKEAIDWLLEVVAEGDQTSARFVVKQLAIYHQDRRLCAKVQAALIQRDDDQLTALFSETWF